MKKWSLLTFRAFNITNTDPLQLNTRLSTTYWTSQYDLFFSTPVDRIALTSIIDTRGVIYGGNFHLPTINRSILVNVCWQQRAQNIHPFKHSLVHSLIHSFNALHTHTHTCIGLLANKSIYTFNQAYNLTAWVWQAMQVLRTTITNVL